MFFQNFSVWFAEQSFFKRLMCYPRASVYADKGVEHGANGDANVLCAQRRPIPEAGIGQTKTPSARALFGIVMCCDTSCQETGGV